MRWQKKSGGRVTGWLLAHAPEQPIPTNAAARRGGRSAGGRAGDGGVDEDGLAEHGSGVNESEVTAVERTIAIVSQHEQIPGGDDHLAVDHVRGEHLLGGQRERSVGLAGKVVPVSVDISGLMSGIGFTYRIAVAV